MLRNHQLFNEQGQDLDKDSDLANYEKSFEVEKETRSLDGETIPAGTYKLVDNWGDYVVITDNKGNRYRCPRPVPEN